MADSLIKAIRNKEYEYIQSLLIKGANANSTDIWGRTALMIAASKNSTKIVQLLIDHGADVNKKIDLIGWTPLMESIFHSRIVTQRAEIVVNTDIVKLLVKYGADLDEKNEYGVTALMLASIQRAHSIVRILLRAGANADIYDDKKLTALMHAAHETNELVVKELIDAGADIYATDGNGKTVLELSKQRSQFTIIRLLENEYKLRAAAIAGVTEICNYYKLPSEIDTTIKKFLRS